MVRLLVVLAIVGGLTLFALQNTTPIALTLLGLSTPALPLAVWLLLAIAAGAATLLVITSLYHLSNTLTTPQSRPGTPRPVSPAGGSDRSSAWNPDWQPIAPPPDAPNPIRDRRTPPPSAQASQKRNDDSWEAFGQPLNDNWERGSAQETWEDWQDDSDRRSSRVYGNPEPPSRRDDRPDPRRSWSGPLRSGVSEPEDEDFPDQEGRYRGDRDQDRRDAPPRYEAPYRPDVRYPDDRDAVPDDEPRDETWYDEEPDYRGPVYEEPRTQFQGYDYTVLQDPDEQEDEPEPEAWDDWDEEDSDGVRRDAQGWRSPPPDVTGPPHRTEFERPQSPRASYRSGTIYSYSYRQDNEPDLEQRDRPSPPPSPTDEEANYRVIIPPVRSHPAASSAADAVVSGGEPNLNPSSESDGVETPDQGDRSS